MISKTFPILVFFSLFCSKLLVAQADNCGFLASDSVNYYLDDSKIVFKHDTTHFFYKNSAYFDGAKSRVYHCAFNIIGEKIESDTFSILDKTSFGAKGDFFGASIDANSTFFLKKYDEKGSLLWSKSQPQLSNNIFSTIEIKELDGGEIYLFGSWKVNNNLIYPFLAQFQADGTLIWHQTYSQSSINFEQLCGAVDDRLFLTGKSNWPGSSKLFTISAADGHLIRSIDYGNFYSKIIGMTFSNTGKILISERYVGPTGPSISCYLTVLDTASNLISSKNMADFAPDEIPTLIITNVTAIGKFVNNHFVFGYDRVSDDNAKNHILVVINENLDTICTKYTDNYLENLAINPENNFIANVSFLSTTFTSAKVAVGFAECQLGTCKSTILETADFSKNDFVKISPNPSSQSFLIENVPINCSIEIINSIGKRIYDGLTIQNGTLINVENWLNGLYFIKIAGISQPIKLVVAH